MTPPPAQPRPGAPTRLAGGPPVTLVVRLAGADPVRLALGDAPLSVGGSPDCDIRLPGSSLPARLGHFERTEYGAAFARLAPPTFPILLNGGPLPGPGPVPLRHGDTLALGSADIGVALAATEPIRPAFTLLDQPADESQEHRREREEVARMREELEADRAAWYRRRTEIDAEIEQLRDEARAQKNLLPAEEALAAREAELERSRAELAQIRQGLVEQYQARRDELAQMQEVVRGASAELEGRRHEWLAEVRQRRDELEREAAEWRAAWERDAELRWRELAERFDRDVRQTEPRLLELATREGRLNAAAAEVATAHESLERDRGDWERQRELDQARLTDAESRLNRRQDDLDGRAGEIDRRTEELSAERDRVAGERSRLDGRRVEVTALRADLDRRAGEINLRTEQMIRDAEECEDNVRLMQAEQAEHRVEAERLQRLRAEVEARDEAVADRAAQLEAQQAMLAVLRAKLERDAEARRRELMRLAADRLRQDEARDELQAKLRAAEATAAELSATRTGHDEEARALAERRILIDAATEALQDQQEAVGARLGELAEREEELDRRSSEIAEQAATLKSRLEQTLELQARLEADRSAVRERESTLTGADSARLQFQEQLRKRSDELSSRARHFDEEAARIAEARRELDAARQEWADQNARAESELAAAREELARRIAEAEQQAERTAEREAALARQIERLRETGRAVAAGRKQFAEARGQWQHDQASADERSAGEGRTLQEFRERIHAEAEVLRREAPELEGRAAAARERLTAARDLLRAQLAELHQFAAQSRGELEGVRESLRLESEALREREQALESARADQRLASAQFRQQLLEWQARIAEVRSGIAQNETRLGAKQAEVSAATTNIEETTRELTRQAEELRREREAVAARRTEVEGHLADMREWYRKKLRELARPTAEASGPALAETPRDEPDPGDRQLGELLRRLDLVDAETLTALWDEAGRQRRTLRQVLLTSGVVTLHQLALIEAGNLDGLMLGRFRVVERLRSSPRETLTKIVDPARIDEAGRGLYLLRHLGEAEAADAVRPDEYRQRFLALQAAADPHLERVAEVLEIHGRPAVLVEWLVGAPASEWGAGAAAPGVWLRLLLAAARGLKAAHQAGLVHARLGADRLLLTADGSVKWLGFGEPAWLQSPALMADAADAGVDLRALGRLAEGWSQPPAPKRRGRAKAFPEALAAVVRRLWAEQVPPMGDTAANSEPFADAGELVRTLEALEPQFPCPAEEWGALLAAAGQGAGETPRIRLSA